MLSKQDNEILTRIGPGTLMGDLMRQYWIPFYPSAELKADGPPVRIRLLGEDLIAFRSTTGGVGLVGQHCPHRGASLFFGRNEEEGLRCVYHGWKFDVSGNCTDMPNEPGESNFRHKITHTAYPCREQGGVVWAYMGPRQDPPGLPRIEWAQMPPEQLYVSFRIAENNFMQPIEGEYDTSHISFLHQRLDPDDVRLVGNNYRPQRRSGYRYYVRLDRHPFFETIDTDYGVLIGSRRNTDQAGTYYWRMYPFVFPFHTLIPPSGPDPLFQGHAWVPMDDEHTICINFAYHPTRALNEAELAVLRYDQDGMQGLHPSVDVFLPPDNRPYARYWPRLNKGNDYHFNYESQQSTWYSGLPGVWVQDSGMQESMGPVYDRTKEHLGLADTGQIQIRRRLIAAAKALREQGVAPPGAGDPQTSYLRPAEMLLKADEPDWVAAAVTPMKAGDAYTSQVL